MIFKNANKYFNKSFASLTQIVLSESAFATGVFSASSSGGYAQRLFEGSLKTYDLYARIVRTIIYHDDFLKNVDLTKIYLSKTYNNLIEQFQINPEQTVCVAVASYAAYKGCAILIKALKREGN